MTEMLHRAATQSWPVYEWCYKETMEPHGWLPQAVIDEKRRVVTSSMWCTEYDLQEPAPESRAIMPEAVAAMFRRDWGEFEGYNGQVIETEEPQDGATYATGADWAKSQDWTIIVTLRTDCTPARLVAFERLGRKPWPAMVGRFNERCKRYPGSNTHDGTGLGDVVNGFLEVDAESCIMVGRARSDLLTNYIGAVERGEVQAPFIRFMETEHRLASNDDVYGSGHLPDTISASALAWRGANRTWLLY
jgi:hypothetical protein